MVTKAVFDDGINETIDDADTAIPNESLPTNIQDSTLKIKKNKYFQHCVTLCVLAASFTKVSTNERNNKFIYQRKVNSIYFYSRQRDMASTLILIQYLKNFPFILNFYSLDC